MEFEQFVEQWTGRDMKYHERNSTTGLDFAKAAWTAGAKAERRACLGVIDAQAAGIRACPKMTGDMSLSTLEEAAARIRTR